MQPAKGALYAMTDRKGCLRGCQVSDGEAWLRRPPPAAMQWTLSTPCFHTKEAMGVCKGSCHVISSNRCRTLMM
jgi:hypothetical protein